MPNVTADYPCEFGSRITAFFYANPADAHTHFERAISAMLAATGSAVHWWVEPGPSREVRRAYTPTGSMIASIVSCLNGLHCVSLENLSA